MVGAFSSFPSAYCFILKLLKANQRLTIFRNALAKQGVQSVQNYMRRFDAHEAHEYVNQAFEYHGEIPFLYRKFDVREDVPDANEIGGLEVVSSPTPKT